MSRGESSGGGQSCLGYLFEWSDSNSNINHPPKMLSLIPPYAIDDHNTNHPLNLNPITLSSPKPPSSISLINSPSSNNTNTSSYNIYPPPQLQHSGNFLTVSSFSHLFHFISPILHIYILAPSFHIDLYYPFIYISTYSIYINLLLN